LNASIRAETCAVINNAAATVIMFCYNKYMQQQSHLRDEAEGTKVSSSLKAIAQRHNLFLITVFFVNVSKLQPL